MNSIIAAVISGGCTLVGVWLQLRRQTTQLKKHVTETVQPKGDEDAAR